MGEDAFSHNASLPRHGMVAVAMSLSRGLTNVSLQYLNYPTQVIFKSMKLITVMIGSIILLRKSFPIPIIFLLYFWFPVRFYLVLVIWMYLLVTPPQAWS